MTLNQTNLASLRLMQRRAALAREIREIDEKLSRMEYRYETLFENCASLCGCSAFSMVSRSRAARPVQARKLFSAYLVLEVGAGLSEVGRILNRDHSSISHYMDSHQDMLEVYPEYREKWEKLCELQKLEI